MNKILMLSLDQYIEDNFNSELKQNQYSHICLLGLYDPQGMSPSMMRSFYFSYSRALLLIKESVCN